MPGLATTGRDASSVDNSHLKPPMNARPTNVESSIPRTRQRDPNNYPYEFREYPKAMNMLATKEYVDAWHERHRQTGDDGKTYWPGGRPIASKSVVPFLDELNEPVFVYDEDEEREFRATHEGALNIVNAQQQIVDLKSDNERMAAELDKLRAQLAGPAAVEPKEDAKPDDEPVKPNALSGVTKSGEPDKPKAKVTLPPRL